MDDEEPTKPFVQPDTFDTIDEAIAAALSELEPGGTLSVHEEHCELVDEEDQCTCVPMVLTTGAVA